MPCPNPRWLDLEGHHQGTLFWSSASGAKQVSFGQELKTETLVLPASVTSGVLERLWVSSGPILEAVYLDCTGSHTGDADPSIEWRLSPKVRRFEVTARYTIPRIPRGWRLERWVEPPTAFPIDSGGKGNFSPFLVQIAWGPEKSGDASAPSIRLTRDALSDLRDLVASGCAGRRCARVMLSFRQTILELIRDPKPAYERLDWQSGEVQPFGHKYEWRLSTKAAEVRVGCHVTSTDQVLCDLTLTTSAGEVLDYNAFYAEVKLTEPSGFMGFETLARGEARVTISGAALALRGQHDAARKE